jgi:hypothetical protein
MSHDDNLKHMARFKEHVRRHHGFMQLVGRYPDDSGKFVEEPSFLIPGIKKEELLRFLLPHDQGGYNQDSVIFAGPETEGKPVVFKKDADGNVVQDRMDMGEYHVVTPKQRHAIFDEQPTEVMTKSGAIAKMPLSPYISDVAGKKQMRQLIKGAPQKSKTFQLRTTPED